MAHSVGKTNVRFPVSGLVPALALLVGLGAAQAQTGSAADDLIAKLGLVESAAPSRDMPGWKTPRRVVVAVDDEARLDWLKEAAGDVELIPMRRGGRRPDLTDVQGVIGFCTPGLIRAAADLHWIQVGSAGVERCVAVPEVRSGRFLVTNMQRVNAEPIAEHVIAMMLALTRGLPHFLSLQDAETWRPTAFADRRMREIQGKTMLVVGLGGIGTEVARRANALGMRVIATRNSSRDGPDFVDRVGLADELLDLAGRADVVVNAAPLTPKTTDLFDAAFFAAMKPQGYFFNVGRGGSVVTDDLIAALESGALAGAGLDVTAPEPLPPGHPLWTAPNVIITPHVSTRSDRVGDRYWTVVRENLRRYVAGDRMFSVVDVKRGY